MTPWIALTTVATTGDARALARAMVEARLAACVQIHPIDSIYRWQGVVVEESEVRLLFKTTAERYPALADALRARHPYDLPAIVGWPVAAGDAAFAAWVEQATGGVGGSDAV